MTNPNGAGAYRLLVDDIPIAKFFGSFTAAKSAAVAFIRSGAALRIEFTAPFDSEEPAEMSAWRYDRAIAAWQSVPLA